MKKIDKKDLNKVSGGLAWCAPSNGSNGKSYYLDTDARDILSNNGYSLITEGVAPKGCIMMEYEITDANGSGIGDAQMQNLLGAQSPLH